MVVLNLMKFSSSGKLLLGHRFHSKAVMGVFIPFVLTEVSLGTCHVGFSQECKHFKKWKPEALLVIRSQLSSIVTWGRMSSHLVKGLEISLQCSAFIPCLKAQVSSSLERGYLQSIITHHP